nr:unnamed protein product [Digitaria exilis]
MTTYYFHGNLTSLRHKWQLQVPLLADEIFFIALSDGTICRHGRQSCNMSGGNEPLVMAAMNNVSFQLPLSPPREFNYTDFSLVASSAQLEATEKRMVGRHFRHGAVVDLLFQNTALM